MPTVSIVIPTLNEARNLEYVLPALPRDVHEILIVDGHSRDGTVEVAQRLVPDVRIVVTRRRGKGAALRAGFAAATGDIIVAMDADGSSDPKELPVFIAALTSGGCDFAKGSRFLPGGGSADITRFRALGNRGFVLLVRLLFGGRYTDLCYGYNAFWRRALPLLDLESDGFEIETEMNLRALAAGLDVIEVPSFEHSRVYGVSNLNAFRDGWRVVRTILYHRFVRPFATRPANPVAPSANPAIVVSAIQASHGASAALIEVGYGDMVSRASDRGIPPDVISRAADPSTANAPASSQTDWDSSYVRSDPATEREQHGVPAVGRD